MYLNILSIYPSYQATDSPFSSKSPLAKAGALLPSNLNIRQSHGKFSARFADFVTFAIFAKIVTLQGEPLDISFELPNVR